MLYGFGPLYIQKLKERNHRRELRRYMRKSEEKIKLENQIIYFKSSEDMSELDDRSIDVIVTSPPYNIGKDYSSERGRYLDRLPYLEYLQFLRSVFSECHRVLKRDGVFFLNIGDSARDQGKSEDVVRVAVDVGFQRLQTAIWIKSIFGKGHYTPSGGSRRLNNLWEFVFILVKGKKYRFNPKTIGIPYSDKSNIGRYSEVDLRDPGDLLFCPYMKTTGHTVKKGHEAPFPIDLPFKLIQLVPNVTRVLDPFVGTGSTLAAAQKLGVSGIGYEIHPRLNVIKSTILSDFVQIKSPLLPQLEKYSQIITKLLKEAIIDLSSCQKQQLLESLPSKTLKELNWTCEDLNLPNPLETTPISSKRILSLDKHLDG